MHCYACDTELTDYEATIKSPTTGEYLDMCLYCISKAGIQGVSSIIANISHEELEDDFQER